MWQVGKRVSNCDEDEDDTIYTVPLPEVQGRNIFD